MLEKSQIVDWFKHLQDDICGQLEVLNGTSFIEDAWERAEGGGGRSRVIQGAVIEKGGVNFSAVHGPMPEKITNALKISPGHFFASGVSIVLHPVSPMVPIIHMNVRYFEMEHGLWWFGGGIDVTPHYVVEEDAQFFHEYLKEVCDRHHPDYYPKFKNWADDYFYIKHRAETRGIGGIFFDRLGEQDGFTKQGRFDFVKDVGNAFCSIYLHLAKAGLKKKYGTQEKGWQALRRGRYVEFNLVWDKGTKFGLDTNGRTESILMSMPPVAQWIYNHKVEDGSPEAKTLTYLKKGIDWVNPSIAK